jgi:hypothetical protein
MVFLVKDLNMAMGSSELSRNLCHQLILMGWELGHYAKENKAPCLLVNFVRSKDDALYL